MAAGDVTLKFAAGLQVDRVQLSGTWYVRVTRGFEIYVLNYEAGGRRAHISFHKRGCHYKVEDTDAKGGGRVVAQWALPDPIEPTGMLRVATVVIPNRGLGLPAGFQSPQADTVLIPPPGIEQQIEVDVLIEPGRVPMDAWPGQTAEPGAAFVGRATLSNTGDPAGGTLHVTIVSRLLPEGAEAKTLWTAPIRSPSGGAGATSARAVSFQIVDVDGQKLPVLMEAAVRTPGAKDATS